MRPPRGPRGGFFSGEPDNDELPPPVSCVTNACMKKKVVLSKRGIFFFREAMICSCETVDHLQTTNKESSDDQIKTCSEPFSSNFLSLLFIHFFLSLACRSLRRLLLFQEDRVVML